MTEQEHLPVMAKEVVKYLNVKSGGIYVDATVGRGGHLQELISASNNEIIVVAIDKDELNLNYLKEKFKRYSNVNFVKSDFRRIDEILNKIGKIDGILYDCGISKTQIFSTDRGFSFNIDSYLDMRFDKSSKLTAYYVVNNYDFHSLVNIFQQYGDEKHAVKIAKEIVRLRALNPIQTTKDLVNIILRVKRSSKIHPATQVFQALRIEVNDELNALKESLTKVVDFLNEGGRIVVITYHSGEDRIVKSIFKQMSQTEPALLKILTKKVVIPSKEELKVNKSARSAKLRCAERRS